MLGAVLSIAVGGQLSLDGPAHAQAAETFRDDFGAISYAGNDGSATWSGSWRESGEADGPTAGSVQVVASDRCLGGTGNCLRIGTDGGDLANHGASREADLSDATSASLSFHYRRQFQGKPTGSISIQVSGDGGSTWATAGTIPLTGPQGPSSASFDISAHTGARTVARIRLSGQGVAGYLYLDAVEIAAIVAPPATTTTTTTSTTTTTTTTATTTASTTTTTVGTTTTGSPTSTTLATGSSTTSTYATSSTTSVPGSEGSTTTLAGTTSTGEPGDTSAAGGGGTDGAPAPTGTEAQGTAGPPGGETPGTEGQTTADAQEPPGASVDDAAAERDAPAPGADEPPTTLMAVAADAAVDAALPGAALLAVVTALSLAGVVPPARARSDETAVVEDEVEPPLEEA